MNIKKYTEEQFNKVKDFILKFKQLKPEEQKKVPQEKIRPILDEFKEMVKQYEPKEATVKEYTFDASEKPLPKRMRHKNYVSSDLSTTAKSTSDYNYRTPEEVDKMNKNDEWLKEHNKKIEEFAKKAPKTLPF